MDRRGIAAALDPGHLQDWIDFLAAQDAFNNGEAPFQSAQPVTATDWAQLALAIALWVLVPIIIGGRRTLRADIA